MRHQIDTAERQAQTKADRALLSLRYPALFAEPRTSEPKKPFGWWTLRDLQKMGVRDEAGERISHSRLKRALARYRRGARYARGLLFHDFYFDLRGLETDEPISREDRDRARINLQVMNARQRERDERAIARSEQRWGTATDGGAQGISEAAA